MYVFTENADCLTTTLLMSSVVDAVSGAIQIVLISLNLHSIQQQNGCALNATRKTQTLKLMCYQNNSSCCEQKPLPFLW